jgi:hypothetical protein
MKLSEIAKTLGIGRTSVWRALQLNGIALAVRNDPPEMTGRVA